jgi:NTP pyrophosphatase (non-canonical NTP hydrolase)
MNLRELTDRAMEVRVKYSQLEEKKNGKKWTRAELAQGFVGDVGDLMKLVMAKEDLREIENVDAKLEHELSDCLWSILVLAHEYNINLESAFLHTMDELNTRLGS